MIKAVIFDLDNTVYNYDYCHEKAMHSLQEFACKKYSLGKEEFYSSFDVAKRNVKAQLGNTGASHNRLLYMQLFLENINRNPVEDALGLYDRYWDTMLENMTLFPYVIPLMKYLKENGIKIGVLTDLTAHIQHRKIARLGLTGYIDVLVTSEEAGQEKPSDIAFNRLIGKFSCLPDEMLMIGDSQAKDIEGALKVGMKGLLFSLSQAENMEQKVIDYMKDNI